MSKKIEAEYDPEEKPVRGCMCYPRSFVELKILAKKQHWQTVAEITAAVGCGSGCGLCRPYLRKMLETGETEFDIIVPGGAMREEG